MNAIVKRASLAVVLLVLVSLSSPAVSRAQQQNAAVSALGDCLAGSKRLLALFLVDQSQSLRQTDPEHARAGALKASLAGLAELSTVKDASGNPVSVDVAVAGFGKGYSPSPWIGLDPGSLGSALQAADTAGRADGEIDTDYAAALDGAQQTLATRSAELTKDGGAPPCQMIIWFTDGQYDIEPRSTGETKPYAPDIPITGVDAANALEQRGKRHICDDGGTVDGLRNAGVETFVVALTKQIAPPDKAFLQAITEGQAPDGTRCGAARPEGAPPVGAYLDTDQVAGLVPKFFEAVQSIPGGNPLPGNGKDVPVCPRTECNEGRRTFQLDPGITSFNLLAVAGAADIDVVLNSPEVTEPLVLKSGQSGQGKLGSADLHWLWVSQDSVLVEAKLPSQEGAWNGEWAVTFVDRNNTSPGALARSQIYVFGDLVPVLDTTSFRAGTDNEVVVQVKHEAGSPVDEKLFKDVAVDAAVVNPIDGTRTPVALGPPDAEGKRRGTWKAPAPNFPAEVNVSMGLRVTTSSGLSLRPVVRSTGVPVLPPLAYPHVDPTDLQLSSITGTEGGSGVLTVTGSDTSGGCVWVEDAALKTVQKDGGSLDVTTDPRATDKASCFKVEARQTRQLEVRAKPANPVNGQANGKLTLKLTSDANPDVLSTDVKLSVSLAKPVNAVTLWALLVGLMALGLLLPLALLWILNYALARFAPPGELRVATVPIRLTKGGSIQRADTNRDGIGLEVSDFKGRDGPTPTREFSVSTALGTIELTTKVPAFPLQSAYGKATAPGGSRIASFYRSGLGSGGRWAPVPFGLGGTALLLVGEPQLDRASQPGSSGLSDDLTGILVVFAASGGVGVHAEAVNQQRTELLSAGSALVDARRSELEAQQDEGPAPVAPGPAGGDDGDRPPASVFDGPPPSSLGGASAGGPPPSSVGGSWGSQRVSMSTPTEAAPPSAFGRGAKPSNGRTQPPSAPPAEAHAAPQGSAASDPVPPVPSPASAPDDDGPPPSSLPAAGS